MTALFGGLRSGSWRVRGARSSQCVRVVWLAKSARAPFSHGIVQENDTVVLTRTNNPDSSPILTPPLRPRSVIDVSKFDQVFHNHIIGKRLRDVVVSKRGGKFRITEPTLGEYTALSPRIVTPIYPQDAAVLVILLDLHPTSPASHGALESGKLEIFEAGTGHGALTLHLARAIHAANPPQPADLEGVTYTREELNTTDPQIDPKVEAYKKWLESRRAIIQTLDVKPEHSRHAENVVRSYRDGMYYHHINFHVGTIDKYVSSRLAHSPQPFLSHAILDLPDCHTYLHTVATALNTAGSLLVFCPSITQINRCALDIKEKGIPLFPEKVIGLGASVGVGGREWDVRPIKLGALAKAKAARAAARNDSSANDDVSVEKTDETLVEQDDDGSDGWELICRPKVWTRNVGGGFVGIWKKMPQR